ncbi:MAG TPA: hypothetical protein DCG19_09740 [Cryomorphaceae bacterium]|nr:hypothetical protein [Owenweeksia sp.]HAD97675.1 hypothetical protein [Cryomorphaceae bacterium]|tara:strand:- start:186 stop:431 length:246 start_codon:yes stop_codon:yes gene_type:complete
MITLKEILESSITDLPLYQENEGDFRTFLRNRITAFSHKINGLKISSSGLKRSDEELRQRNKILCQGIINTIDAYYQGSPY